MGNTPSAFDKPCALPRIDTPDRFQDRVRALLWQRCLSSREEDWVRTIFETFGTHDGTSCYWSVSDLTRYVAITLPDSLQDDWARAAPLWHRCIRNLGAFPWHRLAIHDDDAPGQLTVDDALVAAVILLRRHEANLGLAFWPESNPITQARADGDSEVEEQDHWRSWLHELMFQCMTDSMAPGEADHSDYRGGDTTAGRFRDADANGDDSHLIQAHKLVSRFNTERSPSDPKIRRAGPPVIPVSELPSSRSRDHGGRIHWEAFRSTVKVLLACQLHQFRYRPDLLSADPDRLNAITGSVMAGFASPSEGDGIGWDEYESQLATTVPYLFSALPRLFSPLILDKGLDHEVVKRSDTLAAAAASIKKAFTSDLKHPTLHPGTIMNLHTLTQCQTFLPADLMTGSARILATTAAREGLSEGHFVAEAIDALRVSARPLLILVQGRGGSGEQVGPGEGEGDVCFGAFLPLDEYHSSSIFQLSPRQRVLSGSRARLRIDDQHDGTFRVELLPRPGPELPVQADDGGDDTVAEADTAAWLELDGRDGSASLHILQGQGLSEVTLSGLPVTALDIVGFPPRDLQQHVVSEGAASSQMDWSFAVSPRPGS